MLPSILAVRLKKVSFKLNLSLFAEVLIWAWYKFNILEESSFFFLFLRFCCYGNINPVSFQTADNTNLLTLNAIKYSFVSIYKCSVCETSSVNTSSLPVAHAVCKDVTKKDRLKFENKVFVKVWIETSDNKHMFDNVCKLPSTAF